MSKTPIVDQKSQNDSKIPLMSLDIETNIPKMPFSIKEQGNNFYCEIETDEKQQNYENKQVIQNHQGNAVDLSNYRKSLLMALLSSLFYSVHNYGVTSAVKLRNNSSSVVYCELFGLLIFYVVIHAYLCIRSYQKCGTFWTRQKSQFINSKTGKLSYIGPLCVILRGALLALNNVNVGFVGKYSRLADVSPSVVLSIVSASSFTVAIAFYILYKEKINYKHLIGMILLIVSVLLMSISKSQSQFKVLINGQEYESVSVMVPVSISLFICFIVTVSSYIVRTAKSHGYNGLRFGIDQLFVNGLVYIPFFLYYNYYEAPYTLQQILYMQIPTIGIIGAICAFNIALNMGKGGIVVAIVQTQNMFALIFFEILIDGRIPNSFETIAILAAVVGSVIIGFAQS
eukprot:403353746